MIYCCNAKRRTSKYTYNSIRWRYRLPDESIDIILLYGVLPINYDIYPSDLDIEALLYIYYEDGFGG
ncbi:MAG: hypothetical protein DRJ32_06100 [Thermoprotei archaeon]|nr:MAG: hypothetical protein DRJ32_06100 [Thermoprotei archaeon]